MQQATDHAVAQTAIIQAAENAAAQIAAIIAAMRSLKAQSENGDGDVTEDEEWDAWSEEKTQVQRTGGPDEVSAESAACLDAGPLECSADCGVVPTGTLQVAQIQANQLRTPMRVQSITCGIHCGPHVILVPSTVGKVASRRLRRLQLAT